MIESYHASWAYCDQGLSLLGWGCASHHFCGPNWHILGKIFQLIFGWDHFSGSGEERPWPQAPSIYLDKKCLIPSAWTTCPKYRRLDLRWQLFRVPNHLFFLLSIDITHRTWYQHHITRAPMCLHSNSRRDQVLAHTERLGAFSISDSRISGSLSAFPIISTRYVTSVCLWFCTSVKFSAIFPPYYSSLFSFDYYLSKSSLIIYWFIQNLRVKSHIFLIKDLSSLCSAWLSTDIFLKMEMKLFWSFLRSYFLTPRFICSLRAP